MARDAGGAPVGLNFVVCAHRVVGVAIMAPTVGVRAAIPPDRTGDPACRSNIGITAGLADELVPATNADQQAAGIGQQRFCLLDVNEYVRPAGHHGAEIRNGRRLPRPAFHRVAGRQPGIQSAVEQANVFDAGIQQTDYILGKGSAQVLLATAALMFFALLVAGLATLLNMALSPALLSTLLLGVVTAAYIVAVGVFSASLVRSTRAVILLFSAIILLCFAIEFGSSLLVSLASTNEQQGLFLLRDTLSALNQLAGWFSPVILLVDGSMSALRSDWITWSRTVGLALLWAAATIGFSMFSFERQGNVR